MAGRDLTPLEPGGVLRGQEGRGGGQGTKLLGAQLRPLLAADRLPLGIKREKASATCGNRNLAVTLPKSKATSKYVRRIPINSGA